MVSRNIFLIQEHPIFSIVWTVLEIIAKHIKCVRKVLNNKTCSNKYNLFINQIGE